MNVRFGRTLALAALVGAALPATGRAANSGGPILGVAKPAAATAPALNAQQWGSRDADEVLISDTDPQPVATAAVNGAVSTGVPSAVPAIGWRSPRKATTDGSIQFTKQATAGSVTGATTTGVKPASASSATGASSIDIDAQLSDAALAAKAYADELARQAANAEAENAAALKVAAEQAAAEARAEIAKSAIEKAALERASIEQAALTKAKITPLPAVDAKSTAESAGEIEPQALKDGNIRLATKFQDSKVRPADGEEAIPAPEVPFNGDKPLKNGDGVDYECMTDCCPPPRPLFWTAGVEASFLAPDLNEGSAGFGAFSDANGNFADYSTSNDDVDDFYLTPRVWIGVQGCLWGANLRYWRLNASEGSYDPILGSNGEWDGPGCGVEDFGYQSCNDLEMYTVDFEITRRVCLHDCWMQFSLGARHAEIESAATLWGAALTDDAQLLGVAGSNRASRGTGILLGWYGRKPIYPCSCVHWFYNLRWSALWGKTETAAQTGAMVGMITTDPDAVAVAGSVNNASTSVNDDMFIGEVQVGLEWDYALRCLPANAFWRISLEYQRWTGGRGYTYANSFAGVEVDDELTALGDALAIADSPDLDLIGLSIGTGLTW